MYLTRLYMHVVPNISPYSNILDIREMLLILFTPSSNTTSSNKPDHECMNANDYINITQHSMTRQYTSLNSTIVI